MRYLKREHSSYDLELFCLIVRILCVLPGKYFFYIKMFYKCIELKRPYSCVIFRVWSQEYLTIWICNNNASSLSSVYLVMLASECQAVKIVKPHAGFDLITYRFVVNLLTQCARLLCDNVEKETAYITTLRFIFYIDKHPCLTCIQ